MRKTALALATVGTLAVASIAAPSPAAARGWFGPAVVGGLAAGAVIGGLAASTYGWGPGPGYWGGYGPYAYDYGGYYPGWGGGYSVVSYGYAPRYYGYRYRRVVRPAFAYYRGPRVVHHWHRWHR